LRSISSQQSLSQRFLLVGKPPADLLVFARQNSQTVLRFLSLPIQLGRRPRKFFVLRASGGALAFRSVKRLQQLPEIIIAPFHGGLERLGLIPRFLKHR